MQRQPRAHWQHDHMTRQLFSAYDPGFTVDSLDDQEFALILMGC